MFPAGPASYGHITLAHPAVWASTLGSFLQRLPHAITQRKDRDRGEQEFDLGTKTRHAISAKLKALTASPDRASASALAWGSSPRVRSPWLMTSITPTVNRVQVKSGGVGRRLTEVVVDTIIEIVERGERNPDRLFKRVLVRMTREQERDVS
jgi:hypothetical protein